MKFSRSQRNGLIVLLILILLLFIFRNIQFQKNIQVDNMLEMKMLEQEIECFYQQVPLINSKPKRQLQAIPFNPNTCSEERLIQIGLSSKQIQQILRYREKGGKFKIKSDLSKIYAIDTNIYKQLEAFILLPKSTPSKAKKKESSQLIASDIKTEKKNRIYININSANAIELQNIKGIGEVWSKRIVKYRDLLGGYHRKEQLLEVYGLTEELYNNIQNQIYTDSLIIKMKINFITAGELSKHPYIDAKLAKKIVIERSFNGPYANMVDLISRNNIHLKKIKKAEPYLQF